MTAIDVPSGNQGQMFIDWSPTHEQAVDLGVEAFLDALSRGEHSPEKLPVALGLRPKVVFAFEEPLVLWGGVECFHVAREICTPTGMKLHDFNGRAFVGEGRIDFKFSASTSVDDMQETWRNVMLSVRVKEEP
jgi:hypothetical protein